MILFLLQLFSKIIDLTAFSTLVQELYTGGNDRQILVWCPSRLISDGVVNQWTQLHYIFTFIIKFYSHVLNTGLDFQDAGPMQDQDNWSDWVILLYLALPVADIKLVWLTFTPSTFTRTITQVCKLLQLWTIFTCLFGIFILANSNVFDSCTCYDGLIYQLFQVDIIAFYLLEVVNWITLFDVICIN